MSVAGTAALVELLLQDARLTEQTTIAADRTRERKRLTLREGANDRFLDGPSSRRLAVVDFDPATGDALPPPARFLPPTRAGTAQGTYEMPEGPSDSPASLAVNAFGTAFLTIRMFEGPDALGREVSWAFPGEQLLIVPRAGERANAQYNRASRSLQFFSFTGSSGKRVHTALSRDIVAHECGHALLDAVAPALYDSSTPESLAIHEAIADIIAVLMALDSQRLRTTVLDHAGDSLNGSTAFSEIAAEFGTERVRAGEVSTRPLRELRNDDTRETLAGKPPHVLSTLLSGVFYDTLCQIFDARFARLKATTSPDTGEPLRPSHAAKAALGHAYPFFRRFVLRAIDYLPPGELSFADVGRAALAADRATVSDEEASDERTERRRLFAERFVTRGLVAAVTDLDGPVPDLPMDAADVPGIHESDYLAYDYVTRHRDAIGIPPGIPFTVLPRVDATKRVGRKDDPPQRELIIKVAWNRDEPARLPSGATKRRLLRSGATLSFQWDTGRCLAHVVSDILASEQREQRDAFVAQLMAEAADPASESPVWLDETSEFIRVGGTHRLLHLDVSDGAKTNRGARQSPAPLPDPPPGVDPGAYFDLVRARRR